MYDYELEAYRELEREMEEERHGYKYRVLMCTLEDGVWVLADKFIYSYSASAVSAMVKIGKSRHDLYDLKIQRKEDGEWKDYLTIEQHYEAVDDARYYDEVSRPYSPSCPWEASGMKVSDFL